MVCPNCEDELIIHRHSQGEVDTCPKCKGIWFKNKNIKPYLTHLHNTRDIPYSEKYLNKQIINKYKFDETPKKCPICRKNLDFYNFAYDSNIIIDECLKCKGFWVDDDEIYKLAIHLKGNPNLKDLGKAIIQDTKGDFLGIKHSKKLSSEFIKIVPMLIFAFFVLILGLIFIFSYYGKLGRI